MEKAKDLIVNRFSKAQATYNANAFAQKEIALRLSKLVSGFAGGDFSPESMLEIGCGTGLLTHALLSAFPFKVVHLNDISSVFAPLFAELAGQYVYRFYAEDAEEFVLDRKYDLIVSSSVFQWFNDPLVFLEKISNHLSRQGIFAFSVFGCENMKEIKKLTGNGLDYLSKDEWIQLLSSHFQILHTEEKQILLHLSSPYNVLRHLRQTGVNAIKQQTLWTPSKMKQFEETYRNLFSVGKQVQLTYHPLYFIVKL